jgi:hypothetical protein
VAVVWRAIGAGLVIVAACVVARTTGAEEGRAPAARSGMQAHVDPATGRLVPEPVVPQPAPPRATRPPLADVPAPGGGMMVELGERFMSRTIATIDADGRLHVDCVTGDGPHVPPASDAAAARSLRVALAAAPAVAARSRSSTATISEASTTTSVAWPAATPARRAAPSG